MSIFRVLCVLCALRVKSFLSVFLSHFSNFRFFPSLCPSVFSVFSVLDSSLLLLLLYPECPLWRAASAPCCQLFWPMNTLPVHELFRFAE